MLPPGSSSSRISRQLTTFLTLGRWCACFRTSSALGLNRKRCSTLAGSRPRTTSRVLGVRFLESRSVLIHHIDVVEHRRVVFVRRLGLHAAISVAPRAVVLVEHERVETRALAER